MRSRRSMQYSTPMITVPGREVRDLARTDVWNEYWELLPGAEMRKVQWLKLKAMLNFAYTKSAFYYRKFNEAGVHPDDIKSFQDFSEKIPVTTKSELREMQSAGYPLGSNMTVSMSEIVWITASTGTTGKPTYTCCTQKDWGMWMECIKRMFWLGGLRPEDVHVHALGLSNWISGISFATAAREIGATVIPVGVPTPVERMLMLIKDLKPTSIVCTPSYAEHLAVKCREILGTDPSQLGLRKFFCGGEPGAGIPSFKEKMEKIWDCDMRDLMGSPEMIAGDLIECSFKQGLHIVNREYCYNEICDPETKLPVELNDGAEGTRVYTSLDKQAGPLIRFDVQDQVRVFSSPCRCGYPGFRFTVTGRYDDMLKIKGVKIWPSTIKDIISTFVPRLTGQFKLILGEKPEMFTVTGPVTLRAEYGAGVLEGELSGLKDEVVNSIRRSCLWAPDKVILTPPGSIPPPQFKAKYIEIEETNKTVGFKEGN